MKLLNPKLASPSNLRLGESSRFLKACCRQPVDATPVWFMRQAGRYLPEYRKLREKYSLLEICRQPELAAEVTLQPVRRLGVDVAILFSDILLPAIPLGVGLEFEKGEGPRLLHPLRSQADVDRLQPVDPASDLGFVLETIRMLAGELGETPLIGFCAAPFTLAAYLVEGGSSRDFKLVKTLMMSEPVTFHGLMDKLSRVLADYAIAQIQAGAQAIQMFDSWVGTLNPQDYREYVQPYSQRVLQAAQNQGVPVIHFGTGCSTLLVDIQKAGGSVIGLDWRIPLDEGWQLFGEDTAVQGNLDPVALLAPLPEIERRVKDVLHRAEGRPGHIFNLGHGVLPETPVEHLQAVVDLVHEYSSKIQRGEKE